MIAKVPPQTGWTDAERAELRAMRMNGMMIKDIAKALGRRPDCVRTCLHRMGIKLPAAIVAERAGDNIRRWRADPANEAKRLGHAQAQWTAERRARLGRMGRASIAQRLAWCPPDRVPEYHRLVRSKRMPAAEARRLIEADIARLAALRAQEIGRGFAARAVEQRRGGGRAARPAPLRVAEQDLEMVP
ncbi:MAG: hypothetical protein JO290_03365 [Sphingomonadaceae bacterium]|nr:hypothetical protein [Sphingomonadaceae bacterium]